jgi:putative ABC transport system permease protein
MKFIQAFKMAMKSIMGNKFRSFLTMLGVIIGVSSVIIAVGFAQGSTKSITDQLKSIGTNLIQVSIPGRGSNIKVDYSDLVKFSDENPGKITAIAPQTTGNATVKFGSKTRSTSLVGSTADLAIIRSITVQQGRFLLDFDNDYLQKVAVIGTAVANDIFKGANPVDQYMKINGQVFRVVGVLSQTDNGQDSGDDDRVIIPVSTAQRLSKTPIRNFLIQASSPDTVNDVMASLTTFMNRIFKITNANGTSNAFRVFNSAQLLSTVNSITGMMSLILGGIAAISLVVGGIGIMNIMLVSVTERTREIGIRKAIGAKRRSVLVQFLIEALMVTGIGGLLGVLIGVTTIHFIIGGLKIVPEVYSMTWISVSFGISLVVGIIFGIFPAYKAANLNPIEALRFE